MTPVIAVERIWPGSGPSAAGDVEVQVAIVVVIHKISRKSRIDVFQADLVANIHKSGSVVAVKRQVRIASLRQQIQVAIAVDISPGTRPGSVQFGYAQVAGHICKAHGQGCICGFGALVEAIMRPQPPGITAQFIVCLFQIPLGAEKPFICFRQGAQQI